MKTALTGLALLVASSTAFADDSFGMRVGFDYSSGTYGNTQSTRILSIPVTGSYQTDDWTLALTVPYIRITGPGGVLPGFGRVALSSAPVANSPRLGRSAGGGTATSAGLGDIVASVGRMVYGRRDEDVTLELVGKVKFGTADADQGLGTGENDYSAQLDGTWWTTEQTAIHATAGYKIVGAPAGIPVNNVAFGAAGVEHATSDHTSLGLKFDYVQKVTAAGFDQRAATLYISEKLRPGSSVMGYVLKGFSDGSPDYGFGASISSAF